MNIKNFTKTSMASSSFVFVGGLQGFVNAISVGFLVGWGLFTWGCFFLRLI